MTHPHTAFLDISQLPVARLPHMPDSRKAISDWLADMESLIAAGLPFVLVYPPIKMEPGASEDPEGRKTTVLWLKAHRESFATYCKGMVLICASDQSDKGALQAMQTPLSKAYGVPVVLADSDADAQAEAQRLVQTSIA